MYISGKRVTIKSVKWKLNTFKRGQKKISCVSTT